MPPRSPLIRIKPERKAASGKGKGGVGKAVLKHVAFTTLKCIECVLCARQHRRLDILSGFFRAETMVCSSCYSKMQQRPYESSCFGKPGYVKTPYNPERVYGYAATSIECNQLCPDAAVCELIVCGPAPNRKIAIKEK